MDEITQLLTKIDWLMTSINNDTTKLQLPELNSELVKLAKILGKAKQLFIRYKVDRDLLEPQLKEKIRSDYELEQSRLESETEKYKRTKITVDEVEMRMKLNPVYQSNVKMKWEQEELLSYLEPIFESYNLRVQSVKFESNLNSKFTTNQW